VLLLKIMGLLDLIKNVGKKVIGGIKTVGGFVVDKAKSVVSTVGNAAKSVGSFIVDKTSAIASGAKDIIHAGIQTVPKVIESTSKAINIINPLNNIGFLALAGLSIFAFLEFSKSDTAQTLAARVPIPLSI